MAARGDLLFEGEGRETLLERAGFFETRYEEDEGQEE